MTYSAPAHTASRGGQSPESSSASAVPMSRITIYGCEPGEAVLFRELAPRYRVKPTTTEASVSEGNIGLALGNRCISVAHKTHIPAATLLALRRVGVTYAGKSCAI